MTTVVENERNPKIDEIVESFKELTLDNERYALSAMSVAFSRRMADFQGGTDVVTGSESTGATNRYRKTKSDLQGTTVNQFADLGFADQMTTLMALVQAVKELGCGASITTPALQKLERKAIEINRLVSGAERATEYPGKWFVDNDYCFKKGRSGDGKFVVYADAIRSYQDSHDEGRFGVDQERDSYVVSWGAMGRSPYYLNEYGRSQFDAVTCLGDKDAVEFLAHRVWFLSANLDCNGREIPLPVSEMRQALEAGVRIKGFSPDGRTWCTGQLIATVHFQEVEREGRKDPYWISYSDAGKDGYTAHPALYEI